METEFLVPSSSSRNYILAITVKKYAIVCIKRFLFCPNLLNFPILFQVFFVQDYRRKCYLHFLTNRKFSYPNSAITFQKKLMSIFIQYLYTYVLFITGIKTSILCKPPFSIKISDLFIH